MTATVSPALDLVDQALAERKKGQGLREWPSAVATRERRRRLLQCAVDGDAPQPGTSPAELRSAVHYVATLAELIDAPEAHAQASLAAGGAAHALAEAKADRLAGRIELAALLAAEDLAREAKVESERQGARALRLRRVVSAASRWLAP